MENLRFTLAAGETKRFEATGRYLEIIDAAGPVTIALSGPAGGISDIARGVLSGTYMASPFAGFDITSPTAQTVELFLSSTDGGTKRQPGVVSVVDSAKERTKANTAFMDGGYIANTTAVRFGTVQLWNPVGSGKLVIVSRISSYCSQTTVANVAFNATAAASLRRQVASKLSGGAAGVSQIRQEDSAAALAASAQLQRQIEASVGNIIDLREPFVLQPGAGLIVWATPVAAVYGLFADFELTEEPV